MFGVLHLYKRKKNGVQEYVATSSVSILLYFEFSRRHLLNHHHHSLTTHRYCVLFSCLPIFKLQKFSASKCKTFKNARFTHFVQSFFDFICRNENLSINLCHFLLKLVHACVCDTKNLAEL